MIDMTNHPLIAMTPDTCFGAPRLKGLRLETRTVSTALEFNTIAEVMDYHDISEAQVLAARAFEDELAGLSRYRRRKFLAKTRDAARELWKVTP